MHTHVAAHAQTNPLVILAIVAFIPYLIFTVIRRLIQRTFGVSKSRARAATLLLLLFGGLGR